MLISLHLRRRAQITLILLLTSLTPSLAALQNVTVDDAVLVGPVVPAYLPAPSYWNPGQDCTGCFVRPDPSQAYNGTWHDVTYSPGNGYAPSISFSFTGSAIYIFFILANNVPSATTLTNVSFLLDGVIDSTFVHQPSTSPNYQYNVAAYKNDALSFGQHNLVVEPADTSANGSSVLILFDYLIYTTNTIDTTSSVSSSTVPSSSTSPTQTSSTTQGTSSSPNNGAIIGGVVAGVIVALALIISFLWYRRYRRRNLHISATTGVIDEFPPSATAAPGFYRDDPSPFQGMGNTLPVQGMGDRIPKPETHSSRPVPPSALSESSSISGSDRPTSGAVHGLIEQVGLLRDEVANLRQIRSQERHSYELDSLPPPQYFDGPGR